MARQRLRRGIEMVKLANRIESLKMQEDDDESGLGQADVPANARAAAGEAVANHHQDATQQGGTREKRSLSKIAKGAIFREVVLAKVREMKDQQAREEFEKSVKDKK